MKRWLFAGALAFAMAGQGLASDLPPPVEPVPPRAPAPYIPDVSPVFHSGGLCFPLNLAFVFVTCDRSDPRNLSGISSTGNFNLTGFLAGPTVGFNFQTDAFVYGAEADFDGSWIDGKKSSPFCSNVGFGAGAQCETKNFWF